MSIDRNDYEVEHVAPRGGLFPNSPFARQQASQPQYTNGARRKIDEADRDDGYVPPGKEMPISPKREMVVEWFSDAAATALSDPNTPLIDGLLDEGAMSVIYGDSNAGKTFVGLNMALHVATGFAWNGRAVKRGLVIYVAAEGGRKIKRRIAALERAYIEENGRDAPKRLFALVRFPIDLRSNEADLNKLLTLIRGAEEAAGSSCAWLIVDTLSRAMAGGDENSPVDMGKIVSAGDILRAETNAHLSYIHHTGKDAARGARGHSLLRAATDTEIEVTPDAVTVTKQRDMEGGFTIGFRIIDVEIGEDQDQRPIHSAVVHWTPGRIGSKEPKEKMVPASMRLLMDIIASVIGETGQQIRPYQDGPLVNATLDEHVRLRYYERIAEQAPTEETATVRSNRQRQSFNRAVKGAIDRKLIVAALLKEERWIWLQ